MSKTPFWDAIRVAAALIGVWLGLKFALPVLLPFLFGGAVALGAEGVVRLLHQRAGLPRAVASGIGVSLVLLILTGLLAAVVALAARQTGRLSAALPRLAELWTGFLEQLRQWLQGVTGRVPGGLGQKMAEGVDRLFSGGGSLLDGVLDRMLNVVSRILEGVTNGFVGVVTGVLAAYMISVRLPRLRRLGVRYVPRRWREKLIPELRGMGRAVWGWAWAQIKLAGVAFVLMAAGFLVLGISNGVGWAAGIALLDAFPILGCSMVLIPWALVCLVQGQKARGIGLLGVCTVVWLVRSALEPRLVGKELGLDSLVTLLSVYGGLKLFGFPGMLLVPIGVMGVLRGIRGLRSGTQ